MTEQPPNPAPQNTQPPAVIDSTPAEETQNKKNEEATLSLREMMENAGQIAELMTEEENLVTEFFKATTKILKPFSKTIELNTSALPKKYEGKISKAHFYLTGQLVLVHNDGEVEILNLAEKENYDLLLEVTSEIMSKLKGIISLYRAKTESRVKFLLFITKELQKIAAIFSDGTI
ncbi:hypothetical protein KEJ15_04880 [Candidatus Bathyarchaeota archaeon]|nr:hypothetical protein [Candidatus Bathyarchaeota archaeon]